jgi:diphthine-ammonia ligase
MMYSGGKDSTYSLGRLMALGHDVVCLITVISENRHSYMLHTQSIEMTKLSARALSLPLIRGHTSGRKEEELKDIRQTILEAKAKYDINGIGTGAIASQYQKTRIDSIGSDCHLAVLSPLWGMDQYCYLKDLISSEYKFILTSVSCAGLDQNWLGKEFTAENLEKLKMLSSKFKFNISFEGGEAESLVLDCPLYKDRRIRILESTINWNGYFGSVDIHKAILENKNHHDKGLPLREDVRETTCSTV